MTTLAGILCIRDGFKLDYCWELSGMALLEFCDEVVICDCDSKDGTRQRIDEWAATEPRINVVNFPWTDPKADPSWWPTWLNYARQHAKSDWCVFTDADEIIHENSYDLIREAANNQSTLRCKRLNFWRDARSLIPPGECCADTVIRVGSKNRWMPSDYPDSRGQETMNLEKPSDVTFHHYGFLRKRTAFFEKAKEVQRIWANDYDPRLEAADKAGGNWMEHDGVVPWKDQLVPFLGEHPKLAKPWLRERGYTA